MVGTGHQVKCVELATVGLDRRPLDRSARSDHRDERGSRWRPHRIARRAGNLTAPGRQEIHRVTTEAAMSAAVQEQPDWRRCWIVAFTSPTPSTIDTTFPLHRCGQEANSRMKTAALLHLAVTVPTCSRSHNTDSPPGGARHGTSGRTRCGVAATEAGWRADVAAPATRHSCGATVPASGRVLHGVRAHRLVHP